MTTSPLRRYKGIIDIHTDNTVTGWIEALDEADAEIDAGLFVSIEDIHRMLRQSIACLESKAEERKRQATNRR